jgi:hypothetical protein
MFINNIRSNNMQTATFTFAGTPGFVTRTIADTFVSWGGMNFQIEAAKPELRAAIDAALASAGQVAAQRNRQAYIGSLSRNARRAQYN